MWDYGGTVPNIGARCLNGVGGSDNNDDDDDNYNDEAFGSVLLFITAILARFVRFLEFDTPLKIIRNQTFFYG